MNMLCYNLLICLMYFTKNRSTVSTSKKKDSHRGRLAAIHRIGWIVGGIASFMDQRPCELRICAGTTSSICSSQARPSSWRCSHRAEHGSSPEGVWKPRPRPHSFHHGTDADALGGYTWGQRPFVQTSPFWSNGRWQVVPLLLSRSKSVC